MDTKTAIGFLTLGAAVGAGIAVSLILPKLRDARDELAALEPHLRELTYRRKKEKERREWFQQRNEEHQAWEDSLPTQEKIDRAVRLAPLEAELKAKREAWEKKRRQERKNYVDHE